MYFIFLLVTTPQAIFITLNLSFPSDSAWQGVAGVPAIEGSQICSPLLCKHFLANAGMAMGKFDQVLIRLVSLAAFRLQGYLEASVATG